jgi:hypothetical protein
MLTLCDGHHRLRHQGKLQIEGSAPEFRFTLVDGTPPPVGAEFSYENSPGVEAGFSYENSGGLNAHLDPAHADQDAVLALKALGMGTREAKRRVRRVLGGVPQPWTAEELLRAALQAA